MTIAARHYKVPDKCLNCDHTIIQQEEEYNPLCPEHWANDDGGFWCYKHPSVIFEGDCQRCLAEKQKRKEQKCD